MKRLVTFPVLAALLASAFLILASARPARACGGAGAAGGGVAVLALGSLAIGLADVAFSATDLIGAAGPGLPRGYGFAELGVAAPQALLMGATWASLPSGSSIKGSFGLLTVWTGALALHGGYTAFRDRPRDPREPGPIDRRGPRAPNDPDRAASAAPPRPALKLAPTVLAASDQTLLPGAVLLGRF